MTATADAAGTVQHGESPDYVRISHATALALGMVSGRFAPGLRFHAVNVLLAYDRSCSSDCAYCGLARTRPGEDSERSFIRVQWPLVSTEELVRRLADHEHELTRLCVSMVTHGRAFTDTLEITRRLTDSVATPLSLLVAPPGLTEQRLMEFKQAGADMIGIGLDAVTEEVFTSLRTDVPQGGLRWEHHWRVIDQARDAFGPWKVNCHTLVGLGESDADLMAMFTRLLDREIFSYLFCFNPEPDSRMGSAPRPSLRRWRRVQLAKFLLEERGLDPAVLRFDDDGALVRIHAPMALVEDAVQDGHAFMTNGCPSSLGEPGCTRPMGSWRPSEPPRDYPWHRAAPKRRRFGPRSISEIWCAPVPARSAHGSCGPPRRPGAPNPSTKEPAREHHRGAQTDDRPRGGAGTARRRDRHRA